MHVGKEHAYFREQIRVIGKSRLIGACYLPSIFIGVARDIKKCLIGAKFRRSLS